MDQEDRELLVRIDERTAELMRLVVKGNGQPSLVQRVGVVEAAVQTMRSNVMLLAWLVMAAIAIAGVAVAMGKR